MIQGKNSDVDFKTRKVHVQTEFMPSTKTIVTLIFDNGAIIGSRKKKLVFNGDIDTYKTTIDKKVLDQHTETIQLIKNKAAAEEASAQQAKKEEGGDELLGDYLKDVFGVEDENG